MTSGVNEIFNSRELPDKISDITRIVDPLHKNVMDYYNSHEIIHDIHCFDFWGK